MVNKQDYMNAVNQDIDIVRGDTLSFNFLLSGLGSLAAYNNFSVSFAVAEHYGENPIVECIKGNGITLESYNAAKDEANFNVYVAPGKTISLPIGRYYYDLQIKDSTNTVTLMRGYLTLVYDVAK